MVANVRRAEQEVGLSPDRDTWASEGADRENDLQKKHRFFMTASCSSMAPQESTEFPRQMSCSMPQVFDCTRSAMPSGSMTACWRPVVAGRPEGLELVIERVSVEEGT
jgi:hypothetical protein